MKQIPLKILLGHDLWRDDLVATLIGLGHTVDVLPRGYDVAISYDAWRIPPGTPESEVLEHIGTIIKQVRLTKHVPSETQEPTPERAAKKPRKATGGKRAAKKKGGDAGSEGQPSETSNNERPPKKLPGVSDGETTD